MYFHICDNINHEVFFPYKQCINIVFHISTKYIGMLINFILIHY